MIEKWRPFCNSELWAHLNNIFSNDAGRNINLGRVLIVFFINL